MNERNKVLIQCGLALFAMVLMVVIKINLDAGHFALANYAKIAEPSANIKQFSENYAKGIKALENKNYLKAEEYLLRVLPSDPNYNDARSKLTRLDELISAKYLSDAKSAIASNDLTIAKSLLAISLKYKAESQEAKTLLSEVQSKLNEQAAKKQAEEETKFNPPPIQLSGSGQQTSASFTLSQGLSIFKITHNGSEYFAAWLLDSTGHEQGLLADQTGTFDGSKAFGVKQAGTYTFDVRSGGQWSVTIEQPRPTTAPEITQFSGSSQQATKLFYLSTGPKIFKMNYQGEGDFNVWLLDANGLDEEMLVSKTGNFDGSKAITIREAGLYLLDVHASGNWTVNVE